MNEDRTETVKERLFGKVELREIRPSRKAFLSRLLTPVFPGTVTIDGVLAATMVSGEILIFNAGAGLPVQTDPTTTGVVVRQANVVSVVITGAQFVQVARDAGRRI